MSAREAFAEAIADYLDHLRVRRCTGKTCSTVGRVLHLLRASLRARGREDLRAVREDDLVGFGSELKRMRGKRGSLLASATQAGYMRMAAGFFAFLAKRGTLLHDPAAEIKIPEREALPRTVLTPAQAERLMNAPSAYSQLGTRDRAVLELLYGAGLRRQECERIDVDDVDLQQARLLVRNGKGRQDRVVPIPGRALAAIERYLVEVRPEYIDDPHERALFVGLGRDRGHRLSDSGIYKLVIAAARRAGLERVHPHALRHSCATHVLKGGADIRHVQELLGHRELRSTAIYTRLAPEDLAAAMKRSHPREKKGRPRRKTK